MIVPYYERDGITVYHGDCRSILPMLGSVDAVLTDPPYGIDYSKYLSCADDSEKYQEWIWAVVEEAERHVANGWVVVFQTEKNARMWSTTFPREYCLMSLPKTFGQIGRERISRQTDYALYWESGVPSWPPIGADAPAFFRNWFVSHQASATSKRIRDHPCPRPIDTMLYLVQCFVERIVLDPFMGSGTTLVAAKQLGRKAVGIEIEERYCEIAAERLDRTQRSLFSEPSGKKNKRIALI